MGIIGRIPRIIQGVPKLAGISLVSGLLHLVPAGSVYAEENATPDIAAGGALASLAQTLAPGESAVFPQGAFGRSVLGPAELAWQAHFHYDPTRHEVSLLGDAAGAYYLDHVQFDLRSNAWRVVARDITKAGGHVYGNNTDDGQGNLYHVQYRATRVLKYTRESDSWEYKGKSNKALINGRHYLDGIVWHPGLYEDGGLVVHNVFRFLAWDPSTDSWERLYEIPREDRNSMYGVGVYVPAWDVVVMGGDTLYAINKKGRVTRLGKPPVAPSGGSLLSGKPASLHLHPLDDSHLLLIEHDTRKGTRGRWWVSEDGIEWTLKGEGNPLMSLGKQGWSGCSIPEYGVIWGLSSGSGQSVLWKPAL